MLLAGGANITLSQNGQNISILGGAGAGGGVAISASDTLYTSGTVLFTGSNMVTVKSSGAGQTVIIDATQSVQTQNNVDWSLSTTAGGATAGTMALASSGTVTLYAGNNITLSQSATNKIVISGPNTSVQQTGISSIAASDATYTSGQVQFTGSNMVTVKSSAGQRVVIDATQSVQTQNVVDISIGGNSTSGGGGYQLISSGTAHLRGGNNITLSQDGQTITISAGAGGGGIAAAIGGNSTSAGAGYVTITSGTMLLAGNNNITLSQNGQNISISAASQTVQTQNNVDVSFSTTAGGGTSGTMALISSGTMTMFAGNNITISQSGTNTVVISALASSSLSASANITISSNVSTISFSVANPNSINLHVWENMPMLHAGPMTYLTAISKTPFYWPEVLHGRATLNSVGFLASVVTTGTLQSFSVHFGVYSYANSTSANLIQSVSEAFILSTATSASFSGQRIFLLTSPSTATGISNLTPGAYLFGSMISAGATGSMNLSLYGATNNSAVGPLGIILPGTNNASTGLTQGALMRGLGSSTVNAMPAAVSRADLTVQGSGVSVPIHPYMLIRS